MSQQAQSEELFLLLDYLLNHECCNVLSSGNMPVCLSSESVIYIHTDKEYLDYLEENYP